MVKMDTNDVSALPIGIGTGTVDSDGFRCALEWIADSSHGR